MEETILLADDDEMIVDALGYQLRQEGYNVLEAFDGEEALRLVRSANPDLVLLDVMMPKRQGWEVCREIRRESTVPILMLTARGEEMDRVLGLELGADDYIVKPFSFRELLARIRANMRRVGYGQAADEGTDAGKRTVERIGPLAIDRARYLVTRAGTIINLTNREFDLLVTLLDAQGAVVKRGDLLDRVWGETWIGDPRTLDVHIRWLREKLEETPAEPRFLLTVRGVGYRLVAPDEIPDDEPSA